MEKKVFVIFPVRCVNNRGFWTLKSEAQEKIVANSDIHCLGA